MRAYMHVAEKDAQPRSNGHFSTVQKFFRPNLVPLILSCWALSNDTLFASFGCRFVIRVLTHVQSVLFRCWAKILIDLIITGTHHCHLWTRGVRILQNPTPPTPLLFVEGKHCMWWLAIKFVVSEVSCYFLTSGP